MKNFQLIQHEFIAHIKDPESNPFQGGIEDERLQVYRELFFNNIWGFISNGFPVLKTLYSENNWLNLVRKFFASHQCQSPYFVDISREFVEYLSSEHQSSEADPVFLKELAHYEWLELDLSVRKVHQSFDVWDGESQVTCVSMSQLASLVSYHYPVHQIGPDFQPTESEGNVYIVVYRNKNDEVNFTLVNEVTAHLLTVIQTENRVNVESLVQTMVAAMPQLAPQQVKDSLQLVLEQLLSQQILLPSNA